MTPSRNGTGWVCAFDTEMVTMRFERLKRSRDSDLRALVTVSTTLPGCGPDLIRGYLNLLSVQTRSSWAKELGQSTNGLVKQAQWSDMLMLACSAVETADSQGEPSIALADAPSLGPDIWLARPFILDKLPTVVFGPGGSFKSAFALALAECIARGDGKLLGINVHRAVNPLLLDWEFDASHHRARARAMFGENPRSRHLRMSGLLADQVERIANEVYTHQIGLGIVDSAAYACGKPEESEATNRLFDACRSIPVSWLIVAHQTKAAAGTTSAAADVRAPFGSIFWQNGARMLWWTRVSQEVHSGSHHELSLGIFNIQKNFRPYAPLGWRVSIDNDDLDMMKKCTFTRMDLADDPELSTSLRTSERILHLLRSTPTSAPAMALLLGITPQGAANACRRLQLAGRILQLPGPGAQRWALAVLPTHPAPPRPIRRDIDDYDEPRPDLSLPL